MKAASLLLIILAALSGGLIFLWIILFLVLEGLTELYRWVPTDPSPRYALFAQHAATIVALLGVCAALKHFCLNLNRGGFP